MARQTLACFRLSDSQLLAAIAVSLYLSKELHAERKSPSFSAMQRMSSLSTWDPLIGSELLAVFWKIIRFTCKNQSVPNSLLMKYLL